MSQHSSDSKILMIQSWVDQTEMLVQSQSILDPLSPAETHRIVKKFKQVLAVAPFSLSFASLMIRGLRLIFRLSNHLSDQRQNMVELLQLLLSCTAEATNEEELLLAIILLKKLVLEGGEVAGEDVVQGLTGSLLSIIVDGNNFGSRICNSWLLLLQNLMALETRVELRDGLRQQYDDFVERLVDSLFGCGHYGNQSLVVEVLLR